MKVKIKLTVEQFQNLLNYLQRSVYQNVSELQVLNISLFIKSGLKKLIDLRTDIMYNPTKLKVFSIEINQYISIMSLLKNELNFCDPYHVAIYFTLENQNRNLLKLSI